MTLEEKLVWAAAFEAERGRLRKSPRPSSVAPVLWDEIQVAACVNWAAAAVQDLRGIAASFRRPAPETVMVACGVSSDAAAMLREMTGG